MRSVNKVILIGNVTRDPEVRQTGSGQPVCTFGLATNRQWVTSDGEKHSMAEFHELVAWSRLADICEKYVRKGKLLFVEGYLKTRSWDTPEGVKKFKTEVIVQDLIMLEKRGGNDDDYTPSSNMEDSPAPEAEVEEKPAEEPAAEEKPAEEPKEETPAEEAPEEEEKKDDSANIDMDLGL